MCLARQWVCAYGIGTHSIISLHRYLHLLLWRFHHALSILAQNIYVLGQDLANVKWSGSPRVMCITPALWFISFAFYPTYICMVRPYTFDQTRFDRYWRGFIFTIYMKLFVCFQTSKKADERHAALYSGKGQ